MKKMISSILKIVGTILILILIVILINVLEPAFCKEPDQKYMEQVLKTEYESDIVGKERILCIDNNEEALLWRLRMIGSAQNTITLATFDLRADNSGIDIMSALYCAAERGVRVNLLIDGIYQIPFLNRSDEFYALIAHENVEAKIYNPTNLKNIFRINYRMHDKYIIIDKEMYILGGRNTNDIFLGDYKKSINIDRDILVYDTSQGKGESLLELQHYFEKIWNEPCVRKESARKNKNSFAPQYKMFQKRYSELQEKYIDIDGYDNWKEITYEANKITLVSNETNAGKKAPKVLQVIEHLATKGDKVIIQTPYAICNEHIYGVLRKVADKSELKIILNAVEKGSNPWGCTDYLNHKKDILNTGADVYELMNEYAVHTKTVLVNDNISIVGSYNLDMRSTYLDTELMLVIDCKELNGHIREMTSGYMEKSKEVLSNGQETEGPLFEKKEMNKKKENFYNVLRIIIRPFRHLL